MPVAVPVLREAIHPTNPARAVIAALTGFHALWQLRALGLSDIRDDRLHCPTGPS
jgi:hypothetical protein